MSVISQTEASSRLASRAGKYHCCRMLENEIYDGAGAPSVAAAAAG